MKILDMQVLPVLVASMALLVPLASVSYLTLADMGYLTLLSEEELVSARHDLEPGSSQAIFYQNYLPVSAMYYLDGKAIKLTGATQDLPSQGFWLAAHKTEGEASGWDCELRYQPKRGIFNLYFCHVKDNNQ